MERDLMQLRDNVLRLSLMVDAAIEKAAASLQGHDLLLAKQVIAGDAEINAFRYQIEHECYRILAMQQPTARDMRAVVTIIHISVELERIGDHAAGVAKLVLQLNQETSYQAPEELLHMATIAREMLRGSLDAYLNWDAQAAAAVADRDDEVDRLDKQLYKLLLERMIASREKIDAGTYLLWSSHNFERMADHVTNICERVMFMVTGEMPTEKEG